MKIQLLLTGDELMSGHIVDSNSAMIAELLAHKGYRISRKITVGDNLATLADELEQISAHSDIVIVNGGLGPTVDDLTAEALAQVIAKPLVENSAALEHLTQWCAKRDLVMNDANLKQVILPQGVAIVPNPIGSAVGFSVMHNNCLIICTPGVPSELRLMLKQTIIEEICQRFPSSIATDVLRFQTFGLGESSLQQLLTTHCQDWPVEVELGFRASMPLLEVKLTIRDPKHQALRQQCYQRLQQLIGTHIIGENTTSLAQAVIALLQQKKQSLTTAESCTGGLIAASITEVAGASNVFEAGFVSYSNRMKQTLLAVDNKLLAQYGAVSEEVVRAMAAGALDASHANYTIAVTGIAGPDGGTEEKPVGTVWVAWGSRETLKTHLFSLKASRKWFQQMVTALTLDLLRRELQGIDEEPRYFSRY